jgi:hypothetical protein
MEEIFVRVKTLYPDLELTGFTVRVRGYEIAVCKLPGVESWSVADLRGRVGTGMVLKTLDKVVAAVSTFVKGAPYGIH